MKSYCQMAQMWLISEGSAFGAGTQQVLRPGYADETSGNPFTNVMLQNVEIIRLEDGTEYHLLQGGTGTLDDFYYYASSDRANISGLGDDREHIVYQDSDHNEMHLLIIRVHCRNLSGLTHAVLTVKATDLKWLLSMMRLLKLRLQGIRVGSYKTRR